MNSSAKKQQQKILISIMSKSSKTITFPKNKKLEFADRIAQFHKQRK